MYFIVMIRLLSDEVRFFNFIELFLLNNFYEKWESKNKIFFIEINFMLILLKYLFYKLNIRSFDRGEFLEV